jgi:2',3'-cyclic-nucleotide 2'-phosphodiesterase/3'-nucleotidase
MIVWTSGRTRCARMNESRYSPRWVGANSKSAVSPTSTSGGGAFPGADGSTVILAAPDTNRDVIVRYIVDNGTISPASDGNWRLAPAGGATVIYDTGPASEAYLADVRDRGLTIEPAGDAPDGFLRYRITL